MGYGRVRQWGILMTKFISLTESLADRSTKQLMLNTVYILHIQTGARGRDVHIRMHDKSFYFVKESFEQVEALINPKYESAAEPVLYHLDGKTEVQSRRDMYGADRAANGLAPL